MDTLLNLLRVKLNLRSLAADVAAAAGGVSVAGECLAIPDDATLANLPPPAGIDPVVWGAVVAFITAASRVGLALLNHYLQRRREDAARKGGK